MNRDRLKLRWRDGASDWGNYGFFISLIRLRKARIQPQQDSCQKKNNPPAALFLRPRQTAYSGFYQRGLILVNAESSLTH